MSPVDETTRYDIETSRRTSIQPSGQLGKETKDSNPIAPIHFWIPERLSPSLGRRLAAIASSEDVLRLAVMPDVHEGASFPNGCVLATRTRIYLEAIGKDIGCGVSAIQCNGSANEIATDSLEAILRGLESSVPALKHSRVTRIAELPEACSPGDLSDRRLRKTAMREGVLQCGTLGRGNHFVELQRDEMGMLWIMVHSGSRAMGEAINSLHLSRAVPSAISGLFHLDIAQDAGQAYLNDMAWGVRYATENRLHIINRVADLLECELGLEVLPDTFINCPHNFAALEKHFGEHWIVHRKSANSAREGEIGIIPSSMASGSRIVSGRGNPDSLNSSSHGAGRTMSRRAAIERITSRKLTAVMRGVVYQRERTNELLDEAPDAYKNIKDVMQAQSDLVRTEKTLATILNYKGL